MTSTTTDTIDLLAGIQAGSLLDRLRAQRPETRLNAQKSYEALFAPEQAGDVTPLERFAIAAFVAGLHAEAGAGLFYASRLKEQIGGAALAAVIDGEVEHGRTNGPYGHYPVGPLSREDRPGLIYRVSDEQRGVLGSKLTAALEHSHFLVFRPREANALALKALLDAGWTTTGIVTLSQIVAFLAFQIRVVTGLKALAENAAHVAQTASA
ncbi:MAG: CMD domain protein [Rhizobium sp.]|nr:MAG: CMD domain protein [Rhizobium sp.]